jgi:hypothetical protein
MNTIHDELRGLVDGHFTKGLAPSDEGRLREHLPVCASCRTAYQAYLAAERLDSKGATPRERLAAALDLPAEVNWPRRRGLRWAVGTLSAVGAVALLLLATSGNPSGPKDGMVARGIGVEAPESLEVAVFRVKGERESVRASDAISPGDELAFAYRNEVGKDFLMIFGIDGAGHVAWYHPAWTDPADNPRAVPITRQVGFKELPEAVRHPLQGTSLTVHALFLDKALDVRAVEARVARGEFTADAEAGEILRTMRFEVRP